MLSMESKKTMFEKRQLQFLVGTMRISEQNRHQSSLLTLIHQKKGMVEILQDKRVSEVVHLGS